MEIMDKTGMAPIKDLFRESWEAFKGSLGNVFLLTILGSIVGIGIMIMVFLGVAGMGFLAAYSGMGIEKLSSIQNARDFFTAE